MLLYQFTHNFTCKTMGMIQLALGEKIVEVTKEKFVENFTFMLNMSKNLVIFAV